MPFGRGVACCSPQKMGGASCQAPPPRPHPCGLLDCREGEAFPKRHWRGKDGDGGVRSVRLADFIRSAALFGGCAGEKLKTLFFSFGHRFSALFREAAILTIAVSSESRNGALSVHFAHQKRDPWKVQDGEE